MTHTYLIQPRDTVLFRDGRPFGLTGTEGARSLPFPVPSTTAGLMRTLAGQDEHGCFQPERLEDIKRLHVLGPILVRLPPPTQDKKAPLEWLLPAPADALIVRQEGMSGSTQTYAKLLPLRPLDLPPSAVSDLHRQEVRTLAGATERVQGKPESSPGYWHWSALRQWLEHDAELPTAALENAAQPQTPLSQALAGTLPWTQLSDLRHPGPQEETRTHVGIDPQSGTARTGALFQTRGRSFFQPKSVADSSSSAKPEHEQLGLVLGVRPAADTQVKALSAGPVSLGGERRISFLSPLEEARLKESPFAACPPELRERILKDRACRLFLATPARFTEGSFPTWLLRPGEAFRHLPDVILEAACMDRPQTVSGWDMEKNQPKPTVRLVRAGAVFFLRFPEKWQDADISTWIDTVWLENVSDPLPNDEKHATAKRIDGFGLALLGAWSGKRTPMPGFKEETR